MDCASASMLASAADMKIPHCVDNAEQAIPVVREHYARWLSGQQRTKVAR